MEVSSDPYEQKLYQMFKSYDTESIGTLDKTKLIKLCNSLDLNDQVIHLMLENSHNSRVSFKEFKEALLNFLGTNMENSQCQRERDKNLVSSQNNEIPNHGIPDSPGREVSPKLIVGTKKYGRRSRPQSLVFDISSPSDSENDDNDKKKSIMTNMNKKTQKVQRSSSQSDIQMARKRRPNSGGTKLKRCASLPAQHRNQKIKEQQLSKHQTSASGQNQLTSSVESLGNLDFENLSHKIYEIWKKYGNELGTHSLNCSQLQIVCERVGLLHKIANKVAEEVFEKLNLNSETDKISYMDFIELIQNDNSADNLYNAIDNKNLIPDKIIPTKINDRSSSTIALIDDNNLHDIKDLHVNQGNTVTHLEIAPAINIIEMWQLAGVSDPKHLLSNLGFDDEEINLSYLLSALEEEITSLHGDSQISILKATLVLRKAETLSLQQLVRQLIEENKKLSSDSKDANRRAAMLAQEIDERHANLEDTTKSEMRMLEQRHAEVVRELTSQLSSDREHWSNLNTKLEKRINCLEQEENRLRLELQTIRGENSALEKEQISLQKQITDLLETNIKLNNEIVDLEDKQRNEIGNKGEKETEEVLELIDKITSLQVENANLRDKNDELVAEVEGLNMELCRIKNKKNTIRVASVSTIVDSDILSDDTEQNLLGGIKRRGDSPSKTAIAEESPRLGKLRKCNKDNDNESDTSGDWVALNSEIGNSLTNNPSSATVVTQSTSGFSQDFSSISDAKDENIKQLKDKIIILEKELEKLKNTTKNMKETDTVSSTVEEGTNTDEDKIEQQKIAGDNNTENVINYEIRCQELENSLEQMRKAYEDCEDYWQAKLNEERQLFEEERQIYEEEQQESDKKFAELMEKVQEYEEQFDKKERLSPIEEKDALEQQYADLEYELEEIKNSTQKMLEEKTKETLNLQEEIKILKEKLIENDNSKSSNINLVVDVVDIESPANSPISYLWSQSTIQAPARDYQNPNWDSKQKTDTSAPFESSKVELPKQESTPQSSPPAEQNTCISPIQRPNSQNNNQTSIPNNEIDEVSSNTSGKSCDTNSVASTHSVHRSSISEANTNDRIENLSPNIIKEELKKLKIFEIQLKEQIKDLMYRRDGLVMELQQLHEAKPVLEKAYARAAHPSLIQRVNQLEQKNRHLQNVIRQQQQYTESIMHQNWQQQHQEIIELRNRLESQGILIAEQTQRLTNADILVKDLYVENSHLTATIQRLEQQRSRATLLHQQHQSLTGMP